MNINATIHLSDPISHNELGADMGNVTLFRRMARVVDGRVVRLPIISAGAIRGRVRRLLWREVFDRCGLSRETVGFPGWDRLYAALANGGTIESAETRVSPDEIRARREALPPLSLLGSAMYSSHMAGRLQCGHAWLHCSELGTGPRRSDELVTEITTVRHADLEEQSPDDSGVGPMPTTVEVVIAGASFGLRSAVTGDLEASCWAHGLDLIGVIGGKSGQGNGGVTVEHDGDGARYQEWLDGQPDLGDYLVALSEDLTKGGKRKTKRKTKDKPKATNAGQDLF